MCGIVGYAGSRPALSIALDGLRRRGLAQAPQPHWEKQLPPDLPLLAIDSASLQTALTELSNDLASPVDILRAVQRLAEIPGLGVDSAQQKYSVGWLTTGVLLMVTEAFAGFIILALVIARAVSLLG